MGSLIKILLLLLGIVCGALFGFLLSKLIKSWLSNKRQKDTIRKANQGTDTWLSNVLSTGIIKRILVYCNNLAVKLYYAPDSTRLSARFVKTDKLPNKLEIQRKKSGMTEMYNNIVYRECQARLGLSLLGIGLVFGYLFSTTLAFVLGFAGLLGGVIAPGTAMKKENELRNDQLEKDLPEMLEVIGLGLRSGLTFDRSFQIFIDHFNTEFSHQCSLAINKWQNGITTRENALRELEKSYDSILFTRTIDIIIRSLRFGTSAVENLEQAASDARASYKTKQEEAVAKAPVKMMIPTGVLILPAMLLLVLGPVLLELSGGF